MCEDQEGLVFVSFLHHIHSATFNPQEYKDIKRMIDTIPPKFSAVHLCLPKGQFYEMAKATMMLLIGEESRKRLRLHVGSYQECKNALRSFGIPVCRLPVDLESRFQILKKKQFDLKYHRKWLSIREAKETAIFAAIGRNSKGQLLESNSDGVGSSFKGIMSLVREMRSKFVECPRHEDCLFGKGRSVMSHPGNIAMRRLLEVKINRFEALASIQKSFVAWEVVHQIKQGKGRFLKEDTKHAGVFVITTDDTAFKKIAIAFRDLKKRRNKGGRKGVGGKPVKRSSTYLTEKKVILPIEVERVQQSGTLDLQQFFVLPEGLSSDTTNLGANTNTDADLDIGDCLQSCFLPPFGDDDDFLPEAMWTSNSMEG